MRVHMNPTLRFLGVLVMLPAALGAQVTEAAGIKTIVPFEVGRFDLDLGGSIHRASTAIGARTPFTFQSTLRGRGSRSGFWLGASVEGATEVDSVPVVPLPSGGVWYSFSRIQVSFGTAAHMARLEGHSVRLGTRTDSFPSGDSVIKVTTPVVDTAVASRAAFWSDVEGRVAWRFGRTTMETVIGARPRVKEFAPSLWGRIGLAYPVTSWFSLTANAGTEPIRLGLGVPASTFASVSMRLRPWRPPYSGTDAATPAAFSVRPDSPGNYRVSFIVSGAKSVELSGDFDSWRPIALTEARPGVWEATIALTPGTHHVNVRIDSGRWIAPPGLPRAEDDFSGAVGVLVVR